MTAAKGSRSATLKSTSIGSVLRAGLSGTGSGIGSTWKGPVGSLRCEGIRGDGGPGREPTDRHDLVSQRDPRFLLVRRPDPTQLVKHGGEQVEESFQPLHVLDDSDDLEVQFIHFLGELGTKPPLAVLDLQPDLRLILD